MAQLTFIVGWVEEHIAKDAFLSRICIGTIGTSKRTNIAGHIFSQEETCFTLITDSCSIGYWACQTIHRAWFALPSILVETDITSCAGFLIITVFTVATACHTLTIGLVVSPSTTGAISCLFTGPTTDRAFPTLVHHKFQIVSWRTS